MTIESTYNTKTPALFAYTVREGADGKSFWNRIGAVWANKDAGFSIQLESLPIDGRIVCMPPREKNA